ncbi:ankyrin repeat and SOCS box protein 2b [Siphateles boraxobius]|uniref:ankyrin repeat and SOCS box protein 2b n=1 Tax=Siphateles boraxobius TaxID=180520 RepID=UPI00406349B4
MTRFTYAEYISLFRTNGTKRNSSPQKTSSSERDIEPTELICAVRRGDVQRVRELASACDADDWTALHEAAHCGQTLCVRVLLKARGVCVDKRTLQEQTALMIAVHGRHLDCVRILLEAGADPDISNKNKETPLYKACEQECVGMVELLLSRGASVNQRCRRGWTALHEAARRNNTALCQTLLQAGAAVDARNADDVTAAIEAARHGRTEALACLIQNGAGVNLQTCDGNTALTEACRHGHGEAVKLLLQHQADANKPCSAGLLPLHIASQHGHEEIVSLLLPVSSRVRLRESGVSPLHLCAKHNQLNAMRVLIRSGCDVNTRRSSGCCSALLCAVSAGNTQAAAELLRAGADPDAEPLLLLAAERGCVESVALLLEHGARVEALPALLTHTHHISVLRCLLEHGCDARPLFTPHTHTQEEEHASRSEPGQQFCSWISSARWSRSAALVLDLLLECVGNVQLCSRTTALIRDAPEWPSIRHRTSSPRPLMHLCRLRVREQLGTRRLRSIDSLPLPGPVLRYLSSRTGS